MQIDGFSATDWVESDRYLKIEREQEDGSIKTTYFGEHRELNRDTGRVEPSWPPGATGDNSELVSPDTVPGGGA